MNKLYLCKKNYLKIFNSLSDFICSKKTILTLGTFDGVHLGHRKIIERLTQNHQKGEAESLIFTFLQHPRHILHKTSDIKLLTTIAEKISLLEQIGVQNLVIHPFDEAFSKLSAEEFVKTVLVDQFKVQKIIIGHDHRFGRNREAGIEDLIAFGKKYDFEVEQISAQEIEQVSISSTKIRKALTQGNMSLANQYFGYDYFLTGVVTKGKQLGRTIGFPTANITIADANKLIPHNGVYIIQSIIHEKEVFGMMNIGFNPTVSGESLAIEVHFFNFDSDLYLQEIRVSILSYLRAEQKFNSIEDLKIQLENDKKSALDYLKKQ